MKKISSKIFGLILLSLTVSSCNNITGAISNFLNSISLPISLPGVSGTSDLTSLSSNTSLTSNASNITSTDLTTLSTETGTVTSTTQNPSTSDTTSSTSITPVPAGDYYYGVNELSGDDLLQGLITLNSKKRTSTVGYSSMGTSASGSFKYTDYDPSTIKYDSNGQPYGTSIISFYSGNKITSFTREHVWPNSHGGNLVEADIHMTRPSPQSENGSRGNEFYVEGQKGSNKGWDPAMEDFGIESYRGDAARIIFYCCVASSKLSLVDDDYHYSTNANRDNIMGKVSDLLKWNLEYPVLDREERRNEGAEYLQGNRNPFIDHPEYACRIWGGYNSNTQSICKGRY